MMSGELFAGVCVALQAAAALTHLLTRPGVPRVGVAA